MNIKDYIKLMKNFLKEKNQQFLSEGTDIQYKSFDSADYLKEIKESVIVVELVEDPGYYQSSKVLQMRELTVALNKPVALLIKKGMYRNHNHFALYNIVYEKEFTDRNLALSEFETWLENSNL